MRKILKFFTALLVVTCFILQVPLLAPAQQPVNPGQDQDDPDVQVLQQEILKGPAVAARFNRYRSTRPVGALTSQLTKEGFKPLTKQDDYFGLEVVYRSKPGIGAIKRPQGSVKTTILLQSYAKEGSNDQAAVGSLTISSGKQSDTYYFSLIAPNGDFDNALEYRATPSAQVLKANSWWTCFKKRVRAKCVGVCLEALLTCSGTWTQYLGCVILKCGGCAVKAAACCACDCSWWCKWAVGCCDR